MDNSLENKFDDAMLEIYKRAKKECGYNATRFLQMLTEHGGLETARILLQDKNLSDGFIKMWQLGYLCLTVEALIIDPTWGNLFTSEEKEFAHKRLSSAGYSPAQNK
jgi:hypothetical protein